MRLMQYRLSYTGASLMHNESMKLAECYAELKDWELVKKEVEENNLLQKNKISTIKRVFIELKGRLQKLTPLQFDFLLDSDSTSQRLMIFIGICKSYNFIGEFVVEVLRYKMMTFDNALLDSDYHRFYETKSITNEELENATEATQKKLRTQIFKILEEAGLINSTKDKWITPPMLTRSLINPIIKEDPNLLKFLLVSDLDIKRWID